MNRELVEINAQTDNEIYNDSSDAIFESEDDMKESLTHLCYGDLYILGRLWMEALKTALIGTTIKLVPIVEAAAKPPDPPQKPPPMKYTDLPLYKSPHYEYKDYIEDRKKCPKANVKILHQYLLPKVKQYRKDLEKKSREAKCAVINSYRSVYNSIDSTKRDFKEMMRDPEKLALRQALVLAGGATGFLLGSGRGIPRRLFYTGLGLLSTGALCFPKETDAAFRDFAYHSGKMVITLYNSMCGKKFNLREKLPCKEDLPPPTLPRKSQCPPKKEVTKKS